MRKEVAKTSRERPKACLGLVDKLPTMTTEHSIEETTQLSREILKAPLRINDISFGHF